MKLNFAKTAKRFASALLIGTALVTSVPAFAFDDSEQAEIREIVREYLLENPEIMIEVQQALEAKQSAAADAQKKAVLTASKADIFENPADPVFGNPDGDVTIVEFFDYNCGYCRKGLPDMQHILDTDKNVKFVLKEFPIFGPNSVAVHKVAFAFFNIAPDKYYDYHVDMMSQEGQIDEARALELAEKHGADMEALRDEMNNPAIIASFRDTDALASGLGITGTPSYVVGDEVVVGALGQAVLVEKLKNMRQCNSTTC